MLEQTDFWPVDVIRLSVGEPSRPDAHLAEGDFLRAGHPAVLKLMSSSKVL
jgi:hypothetical protein